MTPLQLAPNVLVRHLFLWSARNYAKHALDIDEIREHIKAGQTPVQLAMTFNDRVSFVLTDTGIPKKTDFLDVVTEQSGFDADAAIPTGELRKLIPDLLQALGGEAVAVSAGAAEPALT